MNKLFVFIACGSSCVRTHKWSQENGVSILLKNSWIHGANAVNLTSGLATESHLRFAGDRSESESELESESVSVFIEATCAGFDFGARISA